jgi:hypothetical protein
VVPAQGEDPSGILEKHQGATMSTTRMRRSGRNIFRTKNPITNKILKSIHVWVFASMAFCGLLFSQQAQKEYIYLGGRTIAVESRSISPLTIAITSPTLESSYDRSY